MEPVVLIVHLILALALVFLVLIQRSEGGGLGIGGGQGGLGSFSSVRGTANFLTKLTWYLAAGFIATSLTLAIMSGAHDKSRGSILDVGLEETTTEGTPAAVVPTTEPTVPTTEDTTAPAADKAAPVKKPSEDAEPTAKPTAPAVPVTE